MPAPTAGVGVSLICVGFLQTTSSQNDGNCAAFSCGRSKDLLDGLPPRGFQRRWNLLSISSTNISSPSGRPANVDARIRRLDSLSGDLTSCGQRPIEYFAPPFHVQQRAAISTHDVRRRARPQIVFGTAYDSSPEWVAFYICQCCPQMVGTEHTAEKSVLPQMADASSVGV